MLPLSHLYQTPPSLLPLISVALVRVTNNCFVLHPVHNAVTLFLARESDWVPVDIRTTSTVAPVVWLKALISLSWMPAPPIAGADTGDCSLQK